MGSFCDKKGNIMRKLVTLRTIDNITPIENADKLECLHIGGWTVVEQKGKFYVGQNIFFFEEDSLIPIDRGYFSHLAKLGTTTVQGKEYFRVRAIRLRGQLSQGMVFPHIIFDCNPIAKWGDKQDLPMATSLTGEECSPYLDPDDSLKKELDIVSNHDGDFSNYFGVIKYDTYTETGRKPLPSFIVKTNQDRVQNLADYLPLIQEDRGFYVATEKIDGSSCSIYTEIRDGDLHYGVCSHGCELEENSSDMYWDIAKTPLINYLGEKLAPLDYLKAKCFEQQTQKMSKYEQRLPRYVLQGELFGEKIQKNPLGVKGRHILFFDLWENDKRVPLIEIEERFPELIKCWVPIHPHKLGSTMEEIVDQPNSVTTLVPYANRNAQIEGFVWRHTRNPELTIQDGEFIKPSSNSLLTSNSFKVISSEYLLKNK